MINPGYKSRVSRVEMDVDAGRVIRCPKCKGIVMEAVADRIKTRCKHCGWWFYLEKDGSSDPTEI